ncbi:hypothetical protein ACSBO6_18675 [Bacillus sp. AL-1R]
MSESIGAVEGYYFSTKNVEECDIYKFKSTENLEKAKQGLIAGGTNEGVLYVNGLFLMGVYGFDNDLVREFKAMK